MRCSSIVVVLLTALPAAAQSPSVLLLKASDSVIDVERDLCCVAFDPNTASTYSLATAQANAQKIQEADAALGTSRFDAIYFPAKAFCIADHDADDIDIVAGDVYVSGAPSGDGKFGGAWIGGGGLTHKRFHGEYSAAKEACTVLIHVGDPGGKMIEYRGVGGRFINLNFRAGLAFNDGQADALLAARDGAGGMASVAFGVYKRAATDISTGKTTLVLGFPLAHIGVQCDSEVNEHADGIICPELVFRAVNYGYQVLNNTCMDHLHGKVETTGYPMKRLYDWRGGGALNAQYVYWGGAGTIYYIDETVGSNNSDYQMYVRIDDQAFDDDWKLLDCNDSDSLARVRIEGSGSANLAEEDHRFVTYRSHGGLGAPDIQLDIKNLDPVVGAAFSRRPVRGAPADYYYATSAFASTKLWVDPTDSTGWDKEVDTASGEDRVETLIDKSGAGNNLGQSTSGSRPKFIKDTCINWRSGLDMYPASQRYLLRNSPTALDDGFDNITVMTVVMLDTNNNGTSRIVACQDNQTGGFSLHLAQSGDTATATFIAGSDSVGSTVVMNELRPYLLIGERNGTTDKISITVDGVTTTLPATNGAVPSVTGPLVVGSRWNTSTSAPADAYEGWIGPIFVDTACWTGPRIDGTTITASATQAGTILTVIGYDVTAADDDKLIYIKDGTNWSPGWYTRVSIDDAANTITINADCTHTLDVQGTGATGMIGAIHETSYRELRDYLRAAYGVW